MSDSGKCRVVRYVFEIALMGEEAGPFAGGRSRTGDLSREIQRRHHHQQQLVALVALQSALSPMHSLASAERRLSRAPIGSEVVHTRAPDAKSRRQFEGVRSPCLAFLQLIGRVSVFFRSFGQVSPSLCHMQERRFVFRIVDTLRKAQAL